MRSMLLAAMRSRGFLVGLAVCLTAVLAGVAVSVQSARATVTTLATFSTPGTYVWTVPTGVTAVTFDVYGARGGSVLQNSGGLVNLISTGGAGGRGEGPLHGPWR